MDALKFCRHCGAAVSATAKFCRTCGKTLELAGPVVQQPPSTPPAATLRQPTCPHCGAAISATAQFCRECGKSVKPSEIPAPSSVPGRIPLARQPVPERATTSAPPATKRRRGGCGFWIVSGCLAVILLCVVAGVGGYLAYQDGTLTSEMVLRLIGQGSPVVEVYNFRNDTIYVTITELSAPKDSTPENRTLQINSFDIIAYPPPRASLYRIEFGAKPGTANLGTCTLTIKRGDLYQFVPLADVIVVDRANQPPSIFEDFLVATSSLCR